WRGSSCYIANNRFSEVDLHYVICKLLFCVSAYLSNYNNRFDIISISYQFKCLYQVRSVYRITSYAKGNSLPYPSFTQVKRYFIHQSPAPRKNSSCPRFKGL